MEKYQVNECSVRVDVCARKRGQGGRVGAMPKDLRLDVTRAKMQAGFAVNRGQHLWNLRTELSRGREKVFRACSAVAWSKCQRPWKEAGNSVSRAGREKGES